MIPARAALDLRSNGVANGWRTAKSIDFQYLAVLNNCIFHTIIRITNRTMSILRAKRYSSAPAMLKPERKSPSMPTVEMLSPFVICAVHDEIIFDLLEFNPSLRSCVRTPSPPSVAFGPPAPSRSLLPPPLRSPSGRRPAGPPPAPLAAL